jgi:hypothetical protein
MVFIASVIPRLASSAGEHTTCRHKMHWTWQTMSSTNKAREEAQTKVRAVKGRGTLA